MNNFDYSYISVIPAPNGDPVLQLANATLTPVQYSKLLILKEIDLNAEVLDDEIRLNDMYDYFDDANVEDFMKLEEMQARLEYNEYRYECVVKLLHIFDDGAPFDIPYMKALTKIVLTEYNADEE